VGFDDSPVAGVPVPAGIVVKQGSDAIDRVAMGLVRQGLRRQVKHRGRQVAPTTSVTRSPERSGRGKPVEAEDAIVIALVTRWRALVWIGAGRGEVR
jgi:hypothetical protein